ncbi:MAG: mechanosensitive ion channel [Anaerolineales bacterium]|nr:mechanosensitive ion channel [Anaerolineales bacterium]
MPWDSEFLSESFGGIQSSLSTWLPALLGALLLLLFGWVIARISQAVIARLFARLGLDRLAERSGIIGGLDSLGIQSPLSYILARLIYWLILIFFILLALGALGLTDVVTNALNGFFAFLPRLVVATTIFLVGAFIARVVGDAIGAVADRSEMPSGRVLGQAVRYSLLLVVTILALDELGVQTTILTTIIIITIAALALGLAMAFGLGNRQVAHGIMAGFHAREEFKPGQDLTVGEHSGRLVRIGATKALIDTGDGTISIPNVILLNEVVRLPAVDAPEAQSDA